MPRAAPERTCVGCRTSRPKNELRRIVRAPDGTIDVDPSGKREGRGAYICPRAECLQAAVRRKALDRALKGPVAPDVVERLRAGLNEPD
ncbi:MAG TPA: YlxR family protein [Armatimonadota bacterium]|jgi:hypothetical protein